MKKLILAIVAVYVVLMGTNYLIHGILLMPDYDILRFAFRSIEGVQQRLWAMAVGQLFFAVAFVYVYARGLERKPWLAQGIRYAIVMILLTVIPFSLSQYDTYAVTYQLVLKWMVLSGIQMIILGLIVAAIYRNAATRV